MSDDSHWNFIAPRVNHIPGLPDLWAKFMVEIGQFHYRTMGGIDMVNFLHTGRPISFHRHEETRVTNDWRGALADGKRVIA